jgi:hypothetical protein
MSEKQTKSKGAAKRPPVSPPVLDQIVEEINNDFNNIKRKLENYAAHLRALDRKRLNGIGIKTQGFIGRTYQHAAENPEFLPRYLPLEKFREDYAYFMGFHSLFESSEQLQEILWNITLQSGDVVYTDSLEFYAMAREASKRRIDPAESIYHDLKPFFRRRRKTEGGHAGVQTEKKNKRDADALMRGKRDGRIVIENISPKLTGGVHKVIDEKFDGDTQFKETEAMNSEQ